MEHITSPATPITQPIINLKFPYLVWLNIFKTTSSIFPIRRHTTRRPLSRRSFIFKWKYESCVLLFTLAITVFSAMPPNGQWKVVVLTLRW
ncbi:hypothetical protein EY921_05970 [Citrobacter freundii]|nr:hypothetical protein EY921_05970 [Citrobacter freundii]